MSNRRRTRPTSRRPVNVSEGEGREIGLDDREIPGGLNHLLNPEIQESKPNVPARRHFKDDVAHGVPIAAPDEPYASPPEDEKVITFNPVPLPPEDAAVPVFIVEHPGKGKVTRSTAAEQVTVAGNAGDPTPIARTDAQRVSIRLLNEDVANDVRFSEDRSVVIEGRGALLKHGFDYLTLTTQKELWAQSVAITPVVLSVIIETEINV